MVPRAFMRISQRVLAWFGHFLHILLEAACFRYLRLKIKDTTEKLKNHQRFFSQLWSILPYHLQRALNWCDSPFKWNPCSNHCMCIRYEYIPSFLAPFIGFRGPFRNFNLSIISGKRLTFFFMSDPFKRSEPAFFKCIFFYICTYIYLLSCSNVSAIFVWR